MKVLLLGGQSLHNDDWLQRLADQLSGDDVTIHRYQFWDKGSTDGRSDEEQVQLEVDRAQDMYASKTFDCIIAKSFGCYVALHVADVCRVRKMLFLGPPVAGLRQYKIDLLHLMRQVHVPIEVVVNRGDEVVGKVDFKPFASKIHITDKSGHKYDDLATYADWVR